jgi:hypothetical protein
MLRLTRDAVRDLAGQLRSAARLRPVLARGAARRTPAVLALVAAGAAALAATLIMVHSPAGHAAGPPTTAGQRTAYAARHHRGADGRTAAARRRPHRTAPTTEPSTSCRSVAHIGDSTSVGMVSADYLPDAAQRLGARYAAVGVRHALIDASGGRSIVEALPGQVNGYNAASTWAGHGYRGCWVIALGTNDTANVSAGSQVGRLARIERMMTVTAGAPTMWVNVSTMLGAGPWSQANMRAWNQTLQAACARYPNMRIFDWAAAVKPAWFVPDGIHYTSAGYAARAAAIGGALARAFPSHGHSHGCLVG